MHKLYGSIRIFSFVVLLLMFSAMAYAFTMTIVHWTGINV